MNYVVISYAMITNRARVSGQAGQGRLPWEGQNLSWGVTMASVLIFPLLVNFNTSVAQELTKPPAASSPSSTTGLCEDWIIFNHFSRSFFF